MRSPGWGEKRRACSYVGEASHAWWGSCVYQLYLMTSTQFIVRMTVRGTLQACVQYKCEHRPSVAEHSPGTQLTMPLTVIEESPGSAVALSCVQVGVLCCPWRMSQP